MLNALDEVSATEKLANANVSTVMKERPVRELPALTTAAAMELANLLTT